jgi:hypothetical protein
MLKSEKLRDEMNELLAGRMLDDVGLGEKEFWQKRNEYHTALHEEGGTNMRPVDKEPAVVLRSGKMLESPARQPVVEDSTETESTKDNSDFLSAFGK